MNTMYLFQSITEHNLIEVYFNLVKVSYYAVILTWKALVNNNKLIDRLQLNREKYKYIIRNIIRKKVKNVIDVRHELIFPFNNSKLWSIASLLLIKQLDNTLWMMKKSNNSFPFFLSILNQMY